MYIGSAPYTNVIRIIFIRFYTNILLLKRMSMVTFLSGLPLVTYTESTRTLTHSEIESDPVIPTAL